MMPAQGHNAVLFGGRLRARFFPGMAMALCAGLLVMSCSKPKENASEERWPDDAVAQVGGRYITVGDVKEEIEHRARNGRTVPAVSELIRDLSVTEAALQAARAVGTDRVPEVHRDVDNLIIAQWKERQAKVRLPDREIPEAELKLVYEKNIARYTRPATVRLALLRLELQKKESDEKVVEATKRLEAARDAARSALASAGTNNAEIVRARGFGRIAADNSDEQTSRYRGGDIGWLEQGAFAYRWPRAVLEAGYGLALGAVSEVIRCPEGVFVVMKTDERPPSVTPFAAVRESLRMTLQAQRRQAVQDALLRDAVAAAPLTVNTQRLAAATRDLDALSARHRKETTESANNPGVPSLP